MFFAACQRSLSQSPCLPFVTTDGSARFPRTSEIAGLPPEIKCGSRFGGGGATGRGGATGATGGGGATGATGGTATAISGSAGGAVAIAGSTSAAAPRSAGAALSTVAAAAGGAKCGVLVKTISRSSNAHAVNAIAMNTSLTPHHCSDGGAPAATAASPSLGDRVPRERIALTRL